MASMNFLMRGGKKTLQPQPPEFQMAMAFRAAFKDSNNKETTSAPWCPIGFYILKTFPRWYRTYPYSTYYHFFYFLNFATHVLFCRFAVKCFCRANTIVIYLVKDSHFFFFFEKEHISYFLKKRNSSKQVQYVLVKSRG